MTWQLYTIIGVVLALYPAGVLVLGTWLYVFGHPMFRHQIFPAFIAGLQWPLVVLDALRRVRRALLFGLMETCLWAFVLKHVIRKVRWPGKTRMTSVKANAVFAALRTGHIIMGIDRKKLSSWWTPGTMAHAALCVNETGGIEEMVGEGLRRTNADRFSWHYDRVIVAECEDWDADYIAKTILPACRRFEETEYDHAFRPGAKCLYCFELIEAVDTEHRLQLVYESLLGRRLVTGDSILKAPNVRVIVDTDNLPSLSQGA